MILGCGYIDVCLSLYIHLSVYPSLYAANRTLNIEHPAYELYLSIGYPRARTIIAINVKETTTRESVVYANNRSRSESRNNKGVHSSPPNLPN